MKELHRIVLNWAEQNKKIRKQNTEKLIFNLTANIAEVFLNRSRKKKLYSSLGNAWINLIILAEINGCEPEFSLNDAPHCGKDLLCNYEYILQHISTLTCHYNSGEEIDPWNNQILFVVLFHNLIEISQKLGVSEKKCINVALKNYGVLIF